MKHPVLLGDSIFDNGAYVNGGCDVISHLRQLIPTGAQATLLARDGSMIRHVGRQLTRLPRDATHLIVSVGGNDLLGEVGALTAQARRVADALLRLSCIRDEFSNHYQTMLDGILQQNLPTALATIYDGAADDELQQRVNSMAVAVVNDVITRAASRCRLALIDLRVICTERADYANPIEPSDRGGAKIAKAISDFVNGEGERRHGA